MALLALAPVEWVFVVLTYVLYLVGILIALVVVAGFVLAPALFLVSGGAKLRKWFHMRGIESAGPATIGEGMQEISGTARPIGESGPAPFSGEETLAWQYRVESPTQKGGSQSRSHIYVENGGYPFEVDHEGTSGAIRPRCRPGPAAST